MIPVYGRHLPDHDETTPSQDALTHARRTVEDFWHAHVAAALRPGRLSAHLARLLARYPRLRALLPKGE
ncbi:hypothetical protein [Streptomyces bottropensis]|uniref:hypothetical protein n=1 Tax=Streptomyces bottropensis TaxID=42235 RepID=UPI0036900BDE